MKAMQGRAEIHKRQPRTWGRRTLLPAVACLAVVLMTGMPTAWALQRHTLTPQRPAKVETHPTAQQPTQHEPAPVHAAQPEGQPAQPHTTAPAATEPTPAAEGKTTTVHPVAVTPEAHPAEHAAAEEHGGVHVTLPQISPIPGVTFVQTMIDIMDYELHGRFWGWRPNDLIVGRLTDNVNQYQLGALEAMRFTATLLRESLTRMGEADTYDRDAEAALNLLMNDAKVFWFPSAESSYEKAVNHLRRFQQKLESGQRNFYYRVDTLLQIVRSYRDFLGNVNKNLAMDQHPDGRPVSWFETDNYFYYAKGAAHVMFEILKVVRVGFEAQLTNLDAKEIVDEILHELARAEAMSPWIILDSDFDGFFANHRANLNAALSEASHLLTVIAQMQ